MAANNLETEYKFLVISDDWKKDVVMSIDMRAGYLNNHPGLSAHVSVGKDPVVIIGDSSGAFFSVPIENEEKAAALQALRQEQPESIIRVRLENDEAFLIFKGETKKDDPYSRPEFTLALDRSMAEKLLSLYCPLEETIVKTRYIVPHQGKKWEIDVFDGANKGLVTAEIELSSSKDPFVKPAWVGADVSLEKKYTNASLTKNPYSSWKDDASCAHGKKAGGPGF